MPTYKITWKDGETQVVSGSNIIAAIREAGLKGSDMVKMETIVELRPYAKKKNR